MLACIRDWRARCDGPCWWSPAVSTPWPWSRPWPATARRRRHPPPTASQAWLIRYSFDRLDALNGYASGMPSPAYHQRVWEALLEDPADALARQRIAARILGAIAAETRERRLADALSFASISQAAQQAAGLAALRQHPGPGRYDLLDAIHSCFVKGSLDDGQAAFLDAVKNQLGGNRLGDIPRRAWPRWWKKPGAWPWATTSTSATASSAAPGWTSTASPGTAREAASCT